MADVGRMVGWAGRGWNRDEWDVALKSGAVCRIFQDRATQRWFLEGVVRLSREHPARVHRAPRRVGVFVSPGRVAARSARRARGGARLSGARAARSRRRLRRAALPHRREDGGPQGDHRRGADASSEARGSDVRRTSSPTSRPRQPRSSNPSSPARPRRIAGGLPQSLPPDHAHEAARAERRGRADARRARRLHRRPRRARRARRCSTARATASAACSIGSSACSAATASIVELQRHLRRDEEADNHALVDLAARVPRADRRHQRRALRDAGRAAAVRRAHLHPPPHHARRRRAGGWRRTPSAT